MRIPCHPVLGQSIIALLLSFFFSSRRRHTRFDCDWSSDVCSSDLCSTTEASSCAQVAAKLLPIVMGPSPMEENLRRLTDGIGGRVSGSPEMAKAVEWAVAAFRTAGIEIHTEKYTLPATWSEGETRLALLGP